MTQTRRTTALGTLTAWTVTIALAQPARAAEPPCPVDPAVAGQRNWSPMSARDLDTRLRFIQTQMNLGARRAAIWSWGWGVTFGVTSASMLTAAPFVDKEVQPVLYVAAGSAAVGTLVRAIAVPKVIRERRRLARRLKSGAVDCATVQAAERAMARAGHDESRGVLMLLRVGAIVYNLGIGILLGVGLDRPRAGMRQALIGTVVGQAMFATQPTRMAWALRQYRRGRTPLRRTRLFLPLVLRGGGGITWAGRF